jgi:hypothetical protein
MEVFRYSAAAMPWLALLAAAGMVGVADGVARIGAWIAVERPRLRKSVRTGLFVTVLVAVAATPLLQRGYLARHYQNRTDEQAYLAALRRVPAECGLVVPDDEAEDPTEYSGGVEVFVRYRRIAEEAVRRHEVELDPLHVVGLRAFRIAAAELHRLPRFAEVSMRFFEVTRDPAGPPCWYLYEGTYCAPGLPNFPTTRCRDFLAVEPHRVVATWPIELWSHRLITRPDLRVPPFYDPNRVLALYHLTRP